MDYEADVDFFSLEAETGRAYRIEVASETLEDSWVTVYDADGSELASVFWSDPGLAQQIAVRGGPGSGTHYVGVSGGGIGSYTVTITVLPTAPAR